MYCMKNARCVRKKSAVKTQARTRRDQGGQGTEQLWSGTDWLLPSALLAVGPTACNDAIPSATALPAAQINLLVYLSIISRRLTTEGA